VVLAPYYRRFDLPWDVDPESDLRVRRFIWGGLAALVVFGIVIQFVPKPKVEVAAPIPERLARLMVQEKPKPPPPPPPPQQQVEPEKPREQPKPVPQEQRVEQARKSAERRLSSATRELDAIQSQFAALQPTDTKNLSAGTANAEARSDRSLIASKAGTGSAGVTSASSSAGFGGGAGSLGANNTGAVNSAVAAIGPGGKPGAVDSKGRRGQEGFEEEFDRNKGALYALYTRALRERPELQGKLVLEVTVAPSGEVTACRVVSSELNDAELERKIVARVRLIRFPAGNFAATTFTKPIEFFPG
jgi:periplasmic protein TonB